ncbi:hypothetical protein [Motilibacter aurantiacus]|uniref:hypothetical protein n=1 Tax=Motilibacter aurantiacus TaxID=2714955 RepID=UPI00140C2EC7|nr:hypothetical protein [Motilibacter aurantiacus]NHC46892.1 hypothetical protein [Motilibacter aurantiacus]
MRVLALVPDDDARDAALAGLTAYDRPRLAKLPPYTGTRVSDCGAGTLVVVPVGPGGAAAAGVAAGVAVNRAVPDLVLAVDVMPDLVPGEDAVLVGEAVELDGEAAAVDSWLADEALRRLPSAQKGQAAGPVSTGAYAAARVHGRRFLALTVRGPDPESARAALTELVPLLLASELR